MRTAISLVQTCSACPSQWDGKTDTGEWFYIRYRYGRLQVGIGDTLENAVMETLQKGATQDCYFGWLIGDDLDGDMPTQDMIKHLADVIDFSGTMNVAVDN